MIASGTRARLAPGIRTPDPAMSDTSLAAVERLLRESPQLPPILESVRSFEGSWPPELVEQFTTLFLSRAPHELLRSRSPRSLARLCVGALAFLDRSRGPVTVEVFNPTPDGEGWDESTTVIRTAVSERPFVVDTVREYLHGEGLAVARSVYPVLRVIRDPAGALVKVSASAEGDPRESLAHFEVTRISDEETRNRIRDGITARLLSVIAVTDDFPAMLRRLAEVMEETGAADASVFGGAGSESGLDEVREFLLWLRSGAFLFLGARSYRIDRSGGEEAMVSVESGSGLGLLRDEASSAWATPAPFSRLPPSIQALVRGGGPLIISKARRESPVHRRARMDWIGIKRFGEGGEVIGEHRFLGLFTSRVDQESAERIPILRRKLAGILAEAGAAEGSHDYKEIITIFNSMPKEELFLASSGEIGAEIQAALHSYGSGEVHVTLREDPLRRGVSLMVILPRERYSSSVRRGIEELLGASLGGEVLNVHLALGKGDQARVHFYVSGVPEGAREASVARIRDGVRTLIRSWEDRVGEGLRAHLADDRALALAAHYGAAFSPEYRAGIEPPEAVGDILELEGMRARGDSVSIALTDRPDAPTRIDGEGLSALKVYVRGRRVILSDFMPILENAGLRVVAVTPFEIQEDPDRAAEGLIYLFAVQDAESRAIDPSRAGMLEELILAVYRGDASNDPLNALVLTAGLRWREVEVLRGYATYAFQLGAVPSRLALPSALRNHPSIARLLFRMFEARFDPALPSGPDREPRGSALAAEFQVAMREVPLLADDRALRRLLLLLDATLRTNYYRGGGADPHARSGGVPYISWKFSVEEMSSVNRSRLRYEVWVRSPRMEGIHLRGARVARGGIRWSDRPDDFRTEVAGLVKTQMVKNAVIVPAGSKGGFVVLAPPSDPDRWAEEGKEQYRTLIRGLLDLTDNLIDGETVAPPSVVCRDEPDPYLVVAADKGTASFSDVANEVAAQYGFWLGDAFASGGSNGYDHKVVGITARGGWECVRRHFREMGKDIQSEPFTVVGIGDMSGDVFGNGMLLSRRIRLIAAFDHRHIFLDPDPDPERSFLERERLFRKGRSSWAEYDPSVLSEGGMIVPRGAKSIVLHSAVRTALGLSEEDEVPDGEALVRAVLRAPAELLWNGGIGTYVRASPETDAEVGDPSNDAVRIRADELRVQVVGEGGNLGFTQRARIEFALLGGRINTDAIDNSGGVDLSDHEVNLKILLTGAVASGSLDGEGRNRLLGALTDDVAELVLRNNRSQSLAVSLDLIRAGEGLDDFRQLLSSLERLGFLDRRSESLPTWEALVERSTRGQSITRPELSVLLAYSKMLLTSRLLASPLPEEPEAQTYLEQYFPAAAREAVTPGILGSHRLRREIVAGQLTNELVDLMGAGFVDRISRETGASHAEVARAWFIASRIAGSSDVLGRLRAAEEHLPAPVLARWSLGLSRVLERSTRWIVTHVPAEDPTSRVLEEYVPPLEALRDAFPRLVAGADRELFQSLVAEMQEAGSGLPLARSLVTLRFLDQLLEMVHIGRETGSSPTLAARAFQRSGQLLEVGWLRSALAAAPRTDRWDERVVSSLADDLSRAHRRLAITLLREARTEDGIDAALRAAKVRVPAGIGRFETLLGELRMEERLGSAPLSLAVREASSLAERLAQTP